MTELVAAVIGLTSAAAYMLGVRVLGLRAGGLARAGGAMLEVVGLVVIFLAINAATATTIILGSPLVGARLSLYLATETLWLVLSLLQALVFAAWWRGAGRLDSAAQRGVDRNKDTPR
jgi:hypothetical protein